MCPSRFNLEMNPTILCTKSKSYSQLPFNNAEKTTGKTRELCQEPPPTISLKRSRYSINPCQSNLHNVIGNNEDVEPIGSEQNVN